MRSDGVYEIFGPKLLNWKLNLYYSSQQNHMQVKWIVSHDRSIFIFVSQHSFDFGSNNFVPPYAFANPIRPKDKSQHDWIMVSIWLNDDTHHGSNKHILYF